MPDSKNIDSILIQDMQERATGSKPEPTREKTKETIDIKHSEPPTNQEESPKKVESSPPEDPYLPPSDDSSTAKPPANDPYLPDKEDEKVAAKKEDEPSPIDEYGNPVGKTKLYTEEEVNQRIRERLSRGKYKDEQQQPQQNFTKQQVNQANADGFQHDDNSEESWEVQLEQFIDRTIQKKQVQQAEQQWRQSEYAKQAAFEDKFTSGMNKYQDFHQVIAPIRDKITDTMMMATRSMDNPAAFVYAASKLHPKEIERISTINDPYAQASEIGRLHERMIKERKSITSAPKPLSSPKGDISGKVLDNKINIDQRINDYAKQKRK